MTCYFSISADLLKIDKILTGGGRDNFFEAPLPFSQCQKPRVQPV